ncbi:MAG: cytochrome P450 [Ginsengibacter sp.]
MPTTLFLQSEVQNPFKLYETMLRENPVYWDSSNGLWAIYSYAGCKKILSNPLAHIPATNAGNRDGLNEYALLISGRLARLSNGVQHEMAKQTAQLLFGNMKSTITNNITEKLMAKGNEKDEIDWVNTICRKLPVIVVLKSFDFNEEDCDFILSKIEPLTKIMLPNKTPEQVAAINEISKEIYAITEKHLSAASFYKPLLNTISEKYKTEPEETTSLCVGNLIGLFIQSYDAGRGLLSNSLLQVLNNDPMRLNFANAGYLEKCIIETLRFDPPVHNTRRIAVDDITINNMQIKKGQAILIILAAANRDPHHFNNPNVYNINRANNAEHLTFGIGGHKCPANYLSVRLATEALAWLFGKYQTIELVEKDILYEPIVNVRLPKNISISLA